MDKHAYPNALPNLKPLWTKLKTKVLVFLFGDLRV